MRRLSRNLAEVKESLTFKSKEILDIEVPERAKLKRMQLPPDPGF